MCFWGDLRCIQTREVFNDFAQTYFLREIRMTCGIGAAGFTQPVTSSSFVILPRVSTSANLTLCFRIFSRNFKCKWDMGGIVQVSFWAVLFSPQQIVLFTCFSSHPLPPLVLRGGICSVSASTQTQTHSLSSFVGIVMKSKRFWR